MRLGVGEQVLRGCTEASARGVVTGVVRVHGEATKRLHLQSAWAHANVCVCV